MDTVSFGQGKNLLDKLFSQQTHVLAALTSPTGSQTILRGSVDSITQEGGLVISCIRPPSSGAGFISIPIFDRPLSFAFGDSRDLPDAVRKEVDKRLGNTTLIIRFSDSIERLVLTWRD